MTAGELAVRLFPQGSNGEFNLPPERACVVAHGEGCRLWTADGVEMLDFSMGWGSALPGHGRREITAAIAKQAPRGVNFACVNEQSLALAQELVAVSPACEQVRFCASGTEATMYCLRLARAFRGRPKVLKFEGAYHGAHDAGVASLFPATPAESSRPIMSSAGTEPSAADNLLVAPFNNLDAAAALIRRHRDELAGVIVEPLQRCLPPAPGFLAGLREVAAESGVLLVFDEVVTGFRLAYGGAQEYYGVVPDLVAYGKALGGGLPLGAFGGRRDIMELVSEGRLGSDPRYAWMASTCGGNPASAAASRAALGVYRQRGAYSQLHRLGAYLRELLQRALVDARITGQVLGDGPLAQVAFTDAAACDYRTSRHADPAFARRVMLELFQRRAFINPMSTKFYLSLAHDDAACDEFAAAFAGSLEAAR